MSQFGPNAQGLLAPLTPWLDNPTTSEILLNRPQEIWVENAGKMQRHSVAELTEQRLLRLFQLIASENQQTINESQPMLAGSLFNGCRIQLMMPPVSKYPAFAIRRKSIQQRSLTDYQRHHYYQHCEPVTNHDQTIASLDKSEQHLGELYQAQDWDGFIRHAILYKKVIVISGGTSTGKTTYLNACLQHIPEDERLILLEDTREIEIDHPNQLSLLAVKQTQNQLNTNQVCMQDLVQASLRLRPDRIVIGEIRGKEMLDFLSACSTGHEGSITSIHANNPHIAWMRMKQLYRLNNVPAMTDPDILSELHNVIDVIVQLQKDPKQQRFVQSIYYKHAHFMKNAKSPKTIKEPNQPIYAGNSC